MDERTFRTMRAISEADVIAFYDTYAESWDTRFGATPSTAHFLEQRWRSFEQVLEDDVGQGNALELGVGTGIYIERVSRIFGRVLAVDGSQRMLAVLEKRIRDLGLENVSTLQTDVLSLKGVEPESADVAYFFGLLEHIIDVERFVCEIRRVLRPGGAVIGVMPNGSSPWYLFRRFLRGTGKHCSTDRYYTRRRVARLFELNGFRLERLLYWGAVPAGLRNAFAYRTLKRIEPLLEKSLFRAFLGGMTFKCRKV